jgi:hypothetical protein
MVTKLIPRNSLSIAIAVLLATALIGPVIAADLTLKKTKKEPPTELDSSIRKALQSEAIQLVDGGKAVLEFWFSSELPLQSKPEEISNGLQSVKQTTLLGAVAVLENRRDYRDNDLNTGVYTIRLGLQPQDGNHLGTAEYPFFAVLVLAKNDLKLEGLADYKALVKASSKETATDHPVILSLRPSTSADGELPKLEEPAPEHKSIRVKLPAKAPGSEKATVVFELVYEGKGKI